MYAKVKLLLIYFLTIFILPGYSQVALQTPEQFLGYKLGARFTRHSDLVRYLEYLSREAPTRLQLQTYGTTYEGRPLYLAAIAAPENITRLEEIRQNNLKRIGLLSGQPTANQPAIVWLSYNVHGNEAVSSEAVLQVLYDLLNPTNERTQTWLKNTVVLIDPSVNPDGRERYVQWYNQVANAVPNANPWAREHQEPWPGGRFNHYLFDLNRDLAWQTQQESQQRIALYNQWMPQLHADFHEMSGEATYYFSPAAKPFHEDITPWQREFQQIIGENNRKYFDQNNWLYFTRETYDLFYPSYGDTWPTFNGAIAMTYEQGGSGRAGLAFARTDGDTLTLSERIAHHYTASLATIETVAQRKDKVLQEFDKYYQRNRTNPPGPYKTYVLKTKNQEAKIKDLTTYLDRQQIKYGYVTGNATQRAFNYTTGKHESVKIEPNDLVISMYQPKSTLIKVLFEPYAKLEDSLTYDVTAWALPYAYGLQAYALAGKINQTKAKPQALSRTVTKPAIPQPYAYLARWNSLSDVQFLSALLRQNIKIRYSEKAFATDGETYAPGTLIITRAGNEAMGETFDTIVKAEAEKAGVQVTPTPTGFVSTGVDFGSGSVRYLRKPKVAVLAGPGVSAPGFGEVWHFFEQQIKYPVTVLDAQYFDRVPLSNFDVLVLPGGNYPDILTEKVLNQVRDWVAAGGKLIALESATNFLAGKRGFALTHKSTSDSSNVSKNPYALLKPYGNSERSAISDAVLGGVYRVSLDNTHPLAFGYGDTYFALMQDVNNFGFMKEGWNVGVLKKDIYTSGFVGARARKKLQDTLVLGHQTLGRGQVVYMADNPLFRAFWHNSKLLFGNAVFLVGN
ncbi:M14 family metallopeptidase [Adhaeribacter rhizoryzae]|uniref:Zinc carboxypeptidase n=1 Tax=Adhaeribacter rhizoryzae TaxID=2607907 RepID=A0A5M6DVQ0_9BACT|nr:M14 family metallopeptidase [Adhaeribacter rhizoryzae]KAA5549555.1 zinc carboxypeptidase [Adhaeribacter rhizoryzae]